MKKLLLIIALLSARAQADTWKVDGKTFTEKGDVMMYVLAHNKNAVITEIREVTLNTKKMSFKKAKKGGDS